MILKEIKKRIDQAINQESPYKIEIPPSEIEGDWATNVAFLLAAKEKRKPDAVAREVAGKIERRGLLEKVDVKGGFINLFLDKARIYKELEEILKKGQSYGEENIGKERRVLIEFVSANPTGPLHIGHGRGAALGDSIARILKALGYKVEREYYLNDMGTQVDLLTESIIARIHKRKPPAEGYKGDYINHIAKDAVLSGKKLPEEIREFALEKIKMRTFDVLAKFGISFDRIFSERTLYEQGKINDAISQLREKDLIYEQKGAVWFKSSIFGDEKDRVVVRKDKRPTYLASDIAYHFDKILRGYDLLINIWGADHHGYVKRVSAALQAIGWDPEVFKVILYQLVRLTKGRKPISMSTRQGEFVTLRQVLDEVGGDVSRFFLLMRTATSHLDFDLERAKKQAFENPVYYIQYSHARICSIFKEAEKQGISWQAPLEVPTLGGAVASGDLLLTGQGKCNWKLLKEPEEIKIAKLLCRFPSLLYICYENLEPQPITTYLLDLAKKFHSYYTKIRVLGVEEKISHTRLNLIWAVRCVIKKGLFLLGVSAPERM